VAYVHGLGAKVKLHICGNITPLLELLKQVSPDILDIDWMVDFKTAVDIFAGQFTAVNGNVDPVTVLLQGDEETVRREVDHCIAVGRKNTLIAAGCEVPAETPEANLLLMDELLYR
jgi:uroporphyrinogen decarboxylase